MTYYPRERNPGRRATDPTEAEIAERAAAIRQTWSAARLRENELPTPAAVPVVKADDLELEPDFPGW